MDFNMSDMDGIETIRQIRNRLNLGPEKLPIILLHSSADDEYIIEASNEFGLVGRLVKPILMQSLYECISKSGFPSNQETNSNRDTYVNYKQVKVLLADDNEFNILLVKQMISNMLPNAEIFEAVDGLKAIELFELNHPDLVFMDIQMPELNGHEAAQKIRSLSNGKHIPIIALTAGTHEDERERCIQAGMDDFITKPFVIETLEAVIAKWVSN
jgi:CheY-like chemotaxis protein